MSTIGLIKGKPQNDGRYRPISEPPAPIVKITNVESNNDGRYRPSDDGKYRGENDGKYIGEKTPPPTTRITTRATQPPTKPPTTTPTVRTTKIVEAGKQWETIRLENDIVEDGYHYL